MTEEIKKKRAPKPRKKKENRGGARPGAGRKPGYTLVYPDEQLTGRVGFRIRAITQERINQLRELTKEDTMPFNRMFEAWVEEMAKTYGIE